MNSETCIIAREKQFQIVTNEIFRKNHYISVLVSLDPQRNRHLSVIKIVYKEYLIGNTSQLV